MKRDPDQETGLAAESDRLRCAIEAIEAHGNTALIEAWYRRWKPDYYAKYGLPTTVQYSLSCRLMEHAAALLAGDVHLAKREEMINAMLTAWAGWDPVGTTDFEPLAEAAATALIDGSDG